MSKVTVNANLMIGESSHRIRQAEVVHRMFFTVRMIRVHETGDTGGLVGYPRAW